MTIIDFSFPARTIRIGALALSAACVFALACGGFAGAQSETSKPYAVNIVLPHRLVAGQPATLATLGPDGKLAPHTIVEFGKGQHVQTDATGRANFTAPNASVLVAKAAARSAAVLVDPGSAAAQEQIDVAPFVSLRNTFDICGGGFEGNAEANRVQINDEQALALAASPECIVVTPNPRMVPGTGKISVGGIAAARSATVTFIGFDFQAPEPPLTPGNKGWLTIRAHGSNERLRILVENTAPDVLRFEKGDAQAVTTSGGTANVAQVRVEAIRSGDFDVQAQLLGAPNPEDARRFLKVAEPLATGDVPQSLKGIEDELSRKQKDVAKVRAELERMISLTSPGDFRTLLEAARASL